MVVEDKILEVNNISFSYEDNLIFENISFSIKKKEMCYVFLDRTEQEKQL